MKWFFNEFSQTIMDTDTKVPFSDSQAPSVLWGCMGSALRLCVLHHNSVFIIKVKDVLHSILVI